MLEVTESTGRPSRVERDRDVAALGGVHPELPAEPLPQVGAPSAAQPLDRLLARTPPAARPRATAAS